MKQSLEQIRELIDATDQQLLRLMNKRAELATEVATIKRKDGEAFFYQPQREAQVLQKIEELNQGPLAGKEVSRLFREIMSACLALEQPLNIAYLGPAGTFTEAAALKHFGHSVLVTPVAQIEQVFREVNAANCHYGVVPVENSKEGAVNLTLDLLIYSDLKICGEVELPIHHYLMSKANDKDTVTRVYSHQQALSQCRTWLYQHLSQAEQIPVSSTATAAQKASDDPTAAAIAGEPAATHYNLQVLGSNIEDISSNTTRFWVLGKQETPPSGNDKTSILFSAENKKGVLRDILNCFADSDVNMTRIESRPSQGEIWEYVFFVDVEGHVQDEPVQAALLKLQQYTSLVKVLGAYPKAVL